MANIVDEIRPFETQLVALRDKSPYASERSRAAFLLALLSGLTPSEAARARHGARSHGWYTLQRFLEGGMDGLADGRPGHFRLDRRDEIVARLPKLVVMAPRHRDHPFQGIVITCSTAS